MTATATWRDWSCRVFVTVADDRQRENAAALVRGLMARVEKASSRFRSDSDLERVNRNSGRLVPVSPLLLRLVDIGLAAARTTQGAVDPTVGSDLVRLGYDSDIDVVRGRRGPAPGDASAPSRRAFDHRAVRLDRTLARVGVPRGVSLDLGATAKAWTADEAARVVSRRLATPALVGIGGDLAAVGTPGAPWRVDVAETEDADGVRIGLGGGGLATSSTTSRWWAAVDGTTVHHLVDPRTGGVAVSRWRTASVWARTALAANIASTWLLVDDEAALAWVEARRLSARLIAHDGSVDRVAEWPADLSSAEAERRAS